MENNYYHLPSCWKWKFHSWSWKVESVMVKFFNEYKRQTVLVEARWHVCWWREKQGMCTSLIQREREARNINHTSIRLSSWHFAAIMTVNCETSVGKNAYIWEDRIYLRSIQFFFLKSDLKYCKRIREEKIVNFQHLRFLFLSRSIIHVWHNTRDSRSIEFQRQGSITLGPIAGRARILPC